MTIRARGKRCPLPSARISSARNQVMIQNESGFDANPLALALARLPYGSDHEARQRSPSAPAQHSTSKTIRKIVKTITIAAKILHAALAVTQKQALGLNVDVEVRNDNQGRDHQSRNQHPGNHRREIVQQFLQSQEVPWRFGRIRRVALDPPVAPAAR